ncbi:hypothetical protein [Sphaerisporangium sp. NPDC051011]|uniref:hypothetical protein n=1 Tax=Sphaerisporangium sp. NPDC051011 TaxID=3155792 RepID=UPI0033FB7B87
MTTPDTMAAVYAFPDTSACEAANRAAGFSPQVDDKTRPCMTVAGVQVYAYLDPKVGAVRVSIDLDTPEDRLIRSDETVPVRIDVGDSVVFDDSEQGRATPSTRKELLHQLVGDQYGGDVTAALLDLVVLTRAQLENWASLSLDAGEVAWLDEQIPHSSVPQAIGEICTQLDDRDDLV